VAFVPDALPPLIPTPRELLLATDAARGAISTLAGEARSITNADLLQPLSRREAVLSSRIEGTHTEVREVLLKAAARPEDEEQGTDLGEVLNYLAALELGQDWQSEGRPLGTSLLRELHTRLMQGVRGGDKNPGQFRQKDVYIGNRAVGFAHSRFVPPPWREVPGLITDWSTFAAAEGYYGTLADCAILHYQFETIHPFEDGNGRIGRLVLPLYLMARGVLDRPLLYLSPFFEAHRQEYVDRLLRVSTDGLWVEWLLFFLRAVKSQAEDAMERLHRVRALQLEYERRVKTGTTSRTAFLAIPAVMDNVFISVPQIARATGSSYPAAKGAVEALTSLGILIPYRRIKGAQFWVADEVAKEAYD
jgi:Fic family protein